MVKSRKLDCLNDLRLRILTLDLGPGSDLDEVTLADHYGISRTPLREIVQRLAGDGYLELAENRGAKVASMDLNTMRTFFQTAPLIYANIARLAAENRQPAQIEDLKKTQGPVCHGNTNRTGRASRDVEPPFSCHHRRNGPQPLSVGQLKPDAD